MDRASERLGRVADQLRPDAADEQSGLARQPCSSALASGQSATIALPEKLSEDNQWRVHRCGCSQSCLWLLTWHDRDARWPSDKFCAASDDMAPPHDLLHGVLRLKYVCGGVLVLRVCAWQDSEV